MSISAGTIRQMEALPDDQISVVLQLVNFYSQTPADIFDKICEDELSDPVSEDVIENTISEVRRERYERADRC